MDNFSPTKAFINVDFPTLGFPIIFTKPALCAIILKFIVKVLIKNLLQRCLLAGEPFLNLKKYTPNGNNVFQCIILKSKAWKFLQIIVYTENVVAILIALKSLFFNIKQ